jgi:hypothetical protein
MLLCRPQISHGLAQNRAQVSVASDWPPLYPYTALIYWSLKPRRNVFTTRYELNTYSSVKYISFIRMAWIINTVIWYRLITISSAEQNIANDWTTERNSWGWTRTKTCSVTEHPTLECCTWNWWCFALQRALHSYYIWLVLLTWICLTRWWYSL